MQRDAEHARTARTRTQMHADACVRTRTHAHAHTLARAHTRAHSLSSPNQPSNAPPTHAPVSSPQANCHSTAGVHALALIDELCFVAAPPPFHRLASNT
eukprot:4722521-Pleurochrysis_carterae.AAC.4